MLGGDRVAVEDGSKSELRRERTILLIPLLDYQGALLSTHNAEVSSKGLSPVTADVVEFDSTRLHLGKQKWAAAGTLVEDAQS